MSEDTTQQTPPADPIPECTHSPDGYHEPQQRSTIPACQYCGRIV